MYIKRDIDKTLEEWKNERKRKPLLLRGVRQCGKTSAVRHLAEQFDAYVEVNFERQMSLHSAFEGDVDIPRIISRFEVETGKRIVAGKTLLFLDEIQACPRAISALRYFYEDMPDLHIIAAGSLLEIVLGKKKKDQYFDFPVGRVRSLYLYPLSFTEFLCGDENTLLADYLANHKADQPIDVHETLIERYKTFLFVGGMPEAVSEYFETKSLLACQRTHRDIYINMLDDFNHYDSDVPAETLRRVFEYCMHNVCRQTKASSAIEVVSAYYFDEAIRLLQNANLVHPVKASACDTLPLGASEKETNKKLLVFDTGVYLTQCGLDIGALSDAKVFDDLNKGDVVEMQTGLELIKYADAYEKSALYYWYRSGANAEVDYVTQNADGIVPVEVKASKKGSMQSMYSFLKTHPASPYGIRVSLENFGTFNNIRVVPVYAISRLMEL